MKRFFAACLACSFLGGSAVAQNNSGGGGGAITGPLGPSTAPSGAVSITDTGTLITGYTMPPGGQGVSGLLSSIDTGVRQPLAAGNAIIGKVGIDPANNNIQATPPVNVTATACSGTVTTGGAAINAFTAQTTLHGFTIANIDTTEVMWISFTTTAAASGTDSFPLAPATPTTFASLSSFTSPPGFGLNHALSVVAATSAHKFSCTWW